MVLERGNYGYAEGDVGFSCFLDAGSSGQGGPYVAPLVRRNWMMCCKSLRSVECSLSFEALIKRVDAAISPASIYRNGDGVPR